MSRYTTSRRNFTHTYEGVSGRFDVELTVPEVNSISNRTAAANIDLKIILKVNLAKDDTGRAGGSRRQWGSEGYQFSAWPESEWQYFRRRFVEQSTFWNNKFWLVLSDSGRQSSPYKDVEHDLSIIQDVNADRKYVCPMVVNCLFELRLADASQAHYTLNASHIVNADGTPIDVNDIHSRYILRSNDANVDNGDINTFAIAHEVGHRLGLPHIGVMTEYSPCVEGGSWFTDYDSNASSCYEAADPRLTRDIMGRGSGVDWRDAVPWRAAFRDITGIPITSYIVHTSSYTAASYLPEMIDNHTSRWQEFHCSSIEGRCSIFSGIW